MLALEAVAIGRRDIYFESGFDKTVIGIEKFQIFHLIRRGDENRP